MQHLLRNGMQMCQRMVVGFLQVLSAILCTKLCPCCEIVPEPRSQFRAFFQPSVRGKNCPCHHIRLRGSQLLIEILQLQSYLTVLLHHKANERRNRMINITSIVETLIYKQHCNSNAQRFKVLMKLEPCIILKLFLNFSHSESLYSYNLHSYKSVSCIHFLSRYSSLRVFERRKARKHR